MMELKFILESILFASQKPLAVDDLRGVLTSAAAESEEPDAKAFKRVKSADLIGALEALAAEHREAKRSYELVCVAGAWQFVSRAEYAPWLRVLAGDKARPGRLSQPALETLTIVAYRQPVTRAEIEQIRGVAVDGVMQTLVERGLVEAVGRAEVVGRPMQYGTTRLFLEYFGLRELGSLPAADELRRIPVDRPPSLLTVEAGLATAPPEQLTLVEQGEKGGDGENRKDGTDRTSGSDGTAAAGDSEEVEPGPAAAAGGVEGPVSGRSGT
jgi:segregation and condensation protein B